MKKFTKIFFFNIKILDLKSAFQYAKDFFNQDYQNEFILFQRKENEKREENGEESLNSLFLIFLVKIIDLMTYTNMNYTSSYLKSLIKFIINPENKNSKSIIFVNFVNHRMICQEINKKLKFNIWWFIWKKRNKWKNNFKICNLYINRIKK